MKLGGEYETDKIISKHFERFALEAGLGRPLVKRRIGELAEAIESQLTAMSMNSPEEEDIAKLIRGRCEKTVLRLKN